MAPRPKKKPKVWPAASRYPADELSSMGKTSSDAYIIRTDWMGLRKNPAKNPSTMTSMVFVIL